MPSFSDAKSMAKALRLALAERHVPLSHSDCLELVARQFGCADWNVLAARIEAARPQEAELRLPRDWAITGQTDRSRYRAGIDPAAPGVALIESRLPRDAALADDSFASLMQSIRANAFRGARIRLTAELRTEEAEAGSIWLRVDDAAGRVLAFDNMLRGRKKAALRGTTGWSARSVVLDAPEAAATIHYGVLLKGHGKVRARAFGLSVVARDVPTTDRRYLDGPSNLDFREPDGPEA